MFKDLYSRAENGELTKNYLLQLLKENAREISVFDLMEINALMLEDMKYVQDRYQKEFHGGYAKNFLGRLKEIKDSKLEFSPEEDNIDLIDLRESLIMLKEYELNGDTSNPKFMKVYTIISLYTTYVLNEPIHPVGTVFPGSLQVEEKDGTYYCPVKDANKESPNSVCPMCIAEQLDF